MQNTLGDLAEALQQAVDRAQEQQQNYQLRMLQHTLMRTTSLVILPYAST